MYIECNLGIAYLGHVNEKAFVEEVPDVLLGEGLLVVHLCVDVAVVEELYVGLLHLGRRRESAECLIHVWQSRVENEHYSVAYFDCTRALTTLYLRTSVKSGTHTCCVGASHIDATT